MGMNLRPIDFEWVTMELVKIADICCNGRLVLFTLCFIIYLFIFNYLLILIIR